MIHRDGKGDLVCGPPPDMHPGERPPRCNRCRIRTTKSGVRWCKQGTCGYTFCEKCEPDHACHYGLTAQPAGYNIIMSDGVELISGKCCTMVACRKPLRAIAGELWACSLCQELGHLDCFWRCMYGQCDRKFCNSCIGNHQRCDDTYRAEEERTAKVAARLAAMRQQMAMLREHHRDPMRKYESARLRSKVIAIEQGRLDMKVWQVVKQ